MPAPLRGALFVESDAYEPVSHQAALTEMLDFAHLQQPEIDSLVPAFGTLCRACRALAQNIGQVGFVYP